MNIEWFVVIFLLLNFVKGMTKCPQECTCYLDEKGKLEALCNKGDNPSR